MPGTPPKNSNTTAVCASLLLIELAIASTIFAFSYRKYTTWWRTTHHLSRTNDLIIHTTLFIGTCAPLCAIIGTAVGAAYYWRKRRKYGRYDVKMRKKGRGYWVDPSDREDKKISDEALKINAGIRRESERAEKMINEQREGEVPQIGSLSLAVPSQGGKHDTKRESKLASFFSNPYGWVAKEEESHEFERGLGRSDSVRTCESDEVTKKGVLDIWLGKKSGGKRGEDIEMAMRRT